jgi:hypothetical protein
MCELKYARKNGCGEIRKGHDSLQSAGTDREFFFVDWKWELSAGTLGDVPRVNT